MRKRPSLEIACGLALTFFAVLAAEAAASDSGVIGYDRQLAAEEATVHTTSDRTLHGRLDGIRDGRLYLRLATDGGEVGYSFSRDEIETFDIPGGELGTLGVEAWERGDLDAALQIFSALGRQRARYLPLLDEEQRRPLLLLIRATMEAGDPLATIGYAKQLQPHAATLEEKSTVRDALLGAHAALGMTEETRRLAQIWCAETGLPPSSALGWSLLARLAFDDGDFEQARWIALQPVVFSGFHPTPHLDAAYAYAVAANHQLGDTQDAARLVDEMEERGLTWPDERSLEEIGRIYRSGGTSSESASAAVAPANPPSASTGDTRLTLQDIRKLVGTAGP